MKKTKLLLVTKDVRTYRLFQKQIKEHFDNDINVLSEKDISSYEQIDFILLSSFFLNCPSYPQEKILIARRAIQTSVLEKLVSLPSGSKCLVVNNVAETTYETINYLENLDLDIKFFPYYPGKGKLDVNVDLAIYPHAIELVPKGIKKAIDIGVRPLDFSTLIEIGIRSHVNSDKANLYSAKYIKEIVTLTRNLSNTLNDLNKVNRMLNATLNAVKDGIIVTDPNQYIIKMNRSAKNILGFKENDQTFLNKKLGDVCPKLDLKSKNPSSNNELISINNMKIFVSKTPIKSNNRIGDVTAFQDVTRIQQLEQNIRMKIQKKGFLAQYSTEDILGNSDKIKETIRIMHKIGKTDQSVLILGESGTGKELFAHAIHNLSARKNGPFIPVNFAGLPQSLAESELFGYEEGAFTGGVKGGKKGLFEMANNGTIFLDEIGDASPNLQILLLRILQDKQIMRIGGRSIIPVNIRIIAATNQDLKKLVKEGKFREDLYYRLFVFPLRIPPLRERKEDIPYLVNHFFKIYSPVVPTISDEIMEELIQYNWPGNIRELRNVVQYLSVVNENHRITRNDLPEQFKEKYEEDSTSKDIIHEMEKKGYIKDFYYILLCLNEAKNLGRGKLVQAIGKKGWSLTEQQVRQRMEVLRDLGLIYSGNKGQGSRISKKGSEVLQICKQMFYTH